MRIFRYLVLLAAAVLWASGLLSTVSHWLYEAKVIVDDYRYGDLYRISALPQFKLPQPVCPASHRASDTASTHLYLIGDSFSEKERISQNDFRVSHYQRIRWDFPQRAQLDPTKRNVLLIETIERHFQDHFRMPINDLIVESDTSKAPTPKQSWGQRLAKDFHWKDVEERLESALFSQDWAFWFKELKARLTLNWFDRYNTGVSLSKDRRNIFLNSDTDTTSRLSSFSPLSDQEVDKLVDSVNAVAARYKKLGFDEVYLSIIPNKATILEPNRDVYNHLIERVQQHPTLRVPTIDTYDAFRKASSSPYLISDTHWTCDGRAIWLNLVRTEIGI
ncbi:hypothetical protein ACFSUS_00660 [Spirosoma soli]|uniref:AlgX/AlgJ SGNH hydrolase-like domain-containing protein n=1 Tax=Spirosoma soli TaxID=1770529 RepID=A0ABW5LZ73_9BACT